MMLKHADTALAVRHARLANDLLAMRQKYPPPPPPPKIISKRSRKIPKVDDSGKIMRSNIKVGLVILTILYLACCGIYVNVRWFIY